MLLKLSKLRYKACLPDLIYNAERNIQKETIAFYYRTAHLSNVPKTLSSQEQQVVASLF